MTIQEKFNNTTLRADYSKAINAVLILKQELGTYKEAYEVAQNNKADYRQQVAKAKKGEIKVELFKALSKDPENLRLLKIVNDCANAVKTAEIAVDLALENLGRAIHNIMLFEARENLKNIIKYKVGYKRFAACFKIGEMSPGGFYSYGECRLPYAVDNQYCNFRHYIFDNKIEADKISNYTPYDIFTAEEIKEEVKMAYDARKAAAEKLEALRKELEAENKKRKFYDLKIKNIHLLNINTLDR